VSGAAGDARMTDAASTPSAPLLEGHDGTTSPAPDGEQAKQRSRPRPLRSAGPGWCGRAAGASTAAGCGSGWACWARPYRAGELRSCVERVAGIDPRMAAWKGGVCQLDVGDCPRRPGGSGAFLRQVAAGRSLARATDLRPAPVRPSVGGRSGNDRATGATRYSDAHTGPTRLVVTARSPTWNSGGSSNVVDGGMECFQHAGASAAVWEALAGRPDRDSGLLSIQHGA
jgi:hypothetical protein